MNYKQKIPIIHLSNISGRRSMSNSGGSVAEVADAVPISTPATFSPKSHKLDIKLEQCRYLVAERKK